MENIGASAELADDKVTAAIDDTIDLGFKILGFLCDNKDTPNADELRALAIATIGLVTGPNEKITAEQLADVFEVIAQEARVWNEVNSEPDAH